MEPKQFFFRFHGWSSWRLLTCHEYEYDDVLMGHYIWSNYSDLTRPHPKWWFSKGNLLFQGNLGW